ncbi:hypothetical protein VTI74DRAFT_1112 [Chaetomium olivicolor]
MVGTRMSSSSPAGSVDDCEGGAPLYAASPAKRDSRREGAVKCPPSSNSSTSPASSESSASTVGFHTAEPGSPGEEDPKTPSDQVTRTPEPIKPRRSFSKSALRAAAEALPRSSSGGNAPPALKLASYPGPQATSQRQPSLPIIVAPPPAVNGVPVPVAVAASQTQARASLPGSTTHSFINAMQAMNLNQADDNLLPAQKIHREQICKIQARLWGLRQGLQRQAAIALDFLVSFDYDVQELMNNLIKMSQMMDGLATEAKKLQLELEGIEGDKRGLEATIRDLEGDVKDWKERYQKSETLMSSLAVRSEEDMRTIQFLKEQLRQNEMARMILQEQVEGKRNLWLKVQNEAQNRAAAMDTLIRAGTPLSGQTFAMPMEQSYSQSIAGSARSASIHSGSSHSSTSLPGSVHSGSDRSASVQPTAFPPAAFMYPPGHYLPGPLMPSIPGMPGVAGYTQFGGIPQSQSGPTVFPSQIHQRRPSTSTTGSARSGAAYPTSRYSAPSSRPSSTGPRRPPRVSIIEENGSPKERKRNITRSLARTDLDDPKYRMWAEQFQTLFALVLGFCSAYLHEPPVVEGDDWKKHIETTADGDVWEYICQVCQYIQEQDRGNHALRLLKDRDCRPYLVQRLIVQHIIASIFIPDAWKGFSVDFDRELDQLAEQWKAVDPSRTVERQLIVDRRAKLVAAMMEGKKGEAFKSFKETQHNQYLKKMVAPFLAKRKNANATNEAFYDLFAIAQSAWELSGKLFLSRLSFDYMWTDAGNRFSADAHEPLDGEMDRFSLQRDHWRVKLCATPAVTVRNDQGMTIEIKNILRAGVLVMRY